jgi:hypothetical protein
VFPHTGAVPLHAKAFHQGLDRRRHKGMIESTRQSNLRIINTGLRRWGALPLEEESLDGSETFV